MFKYKIDARINNQITLTKLDLQSKGGVRYENIVKRQLSQEEINSLIEQDATRRGLDTRKRFYDPKYSVIPKLDVVDIDHTSESYLDLISKFQEDSDRFNPARQKRGYGETPRVRNFPASAGQSLRESGSAIDLLCEGDVSKCRVITLTLPASGHDAYKCLSDYSAYATNKLLQVIRDAKNGNFFYFYCIEHQKRGALHWHICLYHQDKEQSRILGEKIVSKWRDILGSISQKRGVDLLFSKGFGRPVQSHEMQSINQTMYSGCAAYFAKYAGKTVMHGRPGCEKDINCINASKYPVSSFWGRSRNLVKICKENSFHFDYEGLEEEIEWKLEEEIELLSQFNPVWIEEPPFEVKKWIPFVGEVVIAKGDRMTFYCNKDDYFKILWHLRYKYADDPSAAIPERARRRIAGALQDGHSEEF
jgi:hypothetical protein